MKRMHPLIAISAIFTVAFLYVPLLAVAAFSVNASKFGLDWKGFTFSWYLKLFHNEMILNAAWNTLVLAVVSTIFATIIGTLMAIGLERFPWGKKFSNFLELVLHIPVVVADIIFAAALVVVFGALRQFFSIFEPGLLTMIIGHITFQIAFVTLVVRSRLIGMGKDTEEAARDLYADTPYMMRHVLLPQLMPGIVAGGMLAFTLSLDDFVISFFTAGPTSMTLPLFIFAAIRRGVTPEIHALSTVVVLLTVVLVVLSERLSRKEES